MKNTTQHLLKKGDDTKPFLLKEMLAWCNDMQITIEAMTLDEKHFKKVIVDQQHEIARLNKIIN